MKQLSAMISAEIVDETPDNNGDERISWMKTKAESIRQHFDKQNYFSNWSNPLKADSNVAAFNHAP